MANAKRNQKQKCPTARKCPPYYFEYATIAEALVGAGATVDLQTKDGITALMLAAANDHLFVVEAQVNAGGGRRAVQSQ